MHFIFVCFVRSSFRTKIKCIRKVGGKSENLQRFAAVEILVHTKGWRSSGYETLSVRNILDSQYFQRSLHDYHNSSTQIKFKAGPLDLSFWLTFLHHGIEKVERYLLWKFHEIIQRKSWSMCHRSWALAYGLYKVVHKIGRLRKLIALARLNLTFLPLGLSFWNLAHLFIMFMATKPCLRFFNFCLGT